jgi:hypothetical protein
LPIISRTEAINSYLGAIKGGLNSRACAKSLAENILPYMQSWRRLAARRRVWADDRASRRHAADFDRLEASANQETFQEFFSARAAARRLCLLVGVFHNSWFATTGIFLQVLNYRYY